MFLLRIGSTKHESIGNIQRRINDGVYEHRNAKQQTTKKQKVQELKEFMMESQWTILTFLRNLSGNWFLKKKLLKGFSYCVTSNGLIKNCPDRR